MLSIRPGILVGLRTSVKGGVEYTRLDKGIVEEDDGAVVEKWDTEKKTLDPEEHRLASAARNRARYLIKSTCAQTPFGLIAQDEERLEESVRAAKQHIREFNQQAQHSIVQIHVIRARFAADDAEAAESIRAALQDLLERLEGLTARGDVDGVRNLCNQEANDLRRLIEESTGVTEEFDAAIACARRNATEVNRRRKAGEEMDAIRADINVQPIRAAHVTLLEGFEETVEVEHLPSVHPAAVGQISLPGEGDHS